MTGRKRLILAFAIFIVALLVLTIFPTGFRKKDNGLLLQPDPGRSKSTPPQQEETLRVERRLAGHDQDDDGLDDLADIVEGGRTEAARQPRYVNAYYRGGYPPATEGVCTDVIWRAFRDAGYDLKKMVDKDIKANRAAYPRVEGDPDPNIDFRRVPNLVSYFKRHARMLTTKVVPQDSANLVQWQGGDIVVYGAPLWHIGIVSDKRRADGVPLLIHNGGPYATENDMLLDWPSPMVYHFRFPKTDWGTKNEAANRQE